MFDSFCIFGMFLSLWYVLICLVQYLEGGPTIPLQDLHFLYFLIFFCIWREGQLFLYRIGIFCMFCFFWYVFVYGGSANYSSTGLAFFGI